MTLPTEETQQDRHIAELDGLRGLAILMVLVHHVFLMPGAASRMDQFLEKATRPLWMGVELFFVLSGFLITRILVRTHGHPAYLRNFFAHRALRIIPVYSVSLLVFLVLLPLVPWQGCDIYRQISGGEKLSFWGYYMNYFYPLNHLEPKGNLGHYWSLCVEQHFYLVWPFALLLFRRHFMVTVIAGILLTTAFRVAWIWYGHWTQELGYFGSHLRMDSLLAGALAFGLFERWKERANFNRILGWCLPFMVVICTALILFVGVRKTAVGNLIGYPMIAATMVCVLLLALRNGYPDRIHRILVSRPMITMAKYSYAMYVFHFPIIHIMKATPLGSLNLMPGVIWPQTALSGTIAIIISFAASWASWHLIEKRAIALKRHFN